MEQKFVSIELQYLRRLLPSLESRMSIIQVGERPVHSNYAIVQLTQIDEGKICFTSRLNLPTDRGLIISFELVAAGCSIHFRAANVQRSVLHSSYLYRAEFDMADLESKVHMCLAKQLKENSASYKNKAIAIYEAFDTYHHSLPLIDFQT